MQIPILLGSLLFAVASAAPTSLADSLVLEAKTDALLFVDSMTVFQTARDATNPATLDWTSDGCTDVPNAPLNENFLPACQRHDFGYRNYKTQNRFTADNKLKIDENLKKDLTAICVEKPDSTCLELVDIYYTGVRVAGNVTTDGSPLDILNELDLSSLKSL